MVKEALVVCSDKRLNVGITVWDMENGDHLLHIPTCASPPRGLLCLTNHFLAASQVQRHGSFAGGAIFIWPLNKPQAISRNYCIEAVGPISCTKYGVYLAGGAPSGNAYIWEVSSGRMLKTWHAHNKSVSCLAFSVDDSLIISGSDDGEIFIWALIRSLLDMAYNENVPSCYLSWSGHQSSITGLICTSGCSSSFLISSCLDGTCKVWDLFSGSLTNVLAFPQGISAIILDRGEQFLCSGSVGGSIFVDAVKIALDDGNAPVILEDHPIVLCGHKGSITALTFSISGSFLISASEDCTVCLWDVKTWTIARRFDHKKGQVTNIVVVPQLLLHSTASDSHHKASHQVRMSRLDKYPQPDNNSKGTVALLPSHSSLGDDHFKFTLPSATLMNQQVLDLEKGWTLAALQMKVETSIEHRLCATTMAKHITDMNKQLRLRLLDLMQCRLSLSQELVTSRAPNKRKKQKVSNSSPPVEEG